MAEEKMTESRQGCLPNTLEYIAKTDRGDFLIQVAWPLTWNEDRMRPAEDQKPVSTL